MNLKKRIWDFFKQKDDIVDRELIKKIGTSITDLNRRVFNLEHKVSDLERKLAETSKILSNVEEIERKIDSMDKVYAHKIHKLETGK